MEINNILRADKPDFTIPMETTELKAAKTNDAGGGLMP